MFLQIELQMGRGNVRGSNHSTAKAFSGAVAKIGTNQGRDVSLEIQAVSNIPAPSVQIILFDSMFKASSLFYSRI